MVGAAIDLNWHLYLLHHMHQGETEKMEINDIFKATCRMSDSHKMHLEERFFLFSLFSIFESEVFLSALLSHHHEF